MDETKLQKYKTVLCQRMLRSGTCRYGLQCDFAHDKLELRRNLQQHWYYGEKCEKEGCEDNECRYAHNDMELMYHPHVFKTQLCQSIAFGPCLKKHYCPFAHGTEELRQGKFDPEDNHQQPMFFPFGGPGGAEGNTSTTTAAGVAPVHAHAAAPLTPINGDFREVTDRLKIQLLDMVDEIASLHFEHARQGGGQKPQALEQLCRLHLPYFTALPRADLDTMHSQCLTVLEFIAQAKERQKNGAQNGEQTNVPTPPAGGLPSPM